MTNSNFDNLIPIYLCSDADRLAMQDDTVLYMHMLRAKLESDIADMDMDFEESESVRTGHKLPHKQRRAARRVQNARHKKSDRLHGKGTFSYEYRENGILKMQTLPNNMRSKSAWSKALHEWGDPDGLKGRVPRTQSVNVHKDIKPVPEQEPTYVGFYGTLEVRKGITVTMEWNVPEAVQGEPV